VAENLLDLGYFRLRLFHIFLSVLYVGDLQRLLRQRQFVAGALLRCRDVGARLLRQRGDAGVHGVVARGKLVEFFVLERRELCDRRCGFARGLLCGATVGLRV
jgi:hypothetical protein